MAVDALALKAQLGACADLADSNALRARYEQLARERGEKVDWNTLPLSPTLQEFYDLRRKISDKLLAAQEAQAAKNVP